MSAFPDSDAVPFLPHRTRRTAVLELAGWTRSVAGLARVRGRLDARGAGEKVVVVPGFGMSDRTTVVLRRVLGRHGFDVRGWGLGVNHGRLDEFRAPMNAFLDRHEQVALVGWSLGGVVAREMGRERPDRVAQVVTLGTPVIGGPKYTVARDAFAEANGTTIEAFNASIAERMAAPLPVPVTAIFSRDDRIVSWPATRDPHTPHTRYVEVHTSHMGLGFDRAALSAVARALAATDRG